jgi:acetyl-CoA carboxylase biotin carboxyl carrier protein
MMDLKELHAIMEMFEESGLSELTIKKNGEEISLKKAIASVQTVLHQAAPAPIVQGHPQGGLGGVPAAVKAAVDVEVIRAPLVGTFYRAPAPDAPPFVEKGDAVKKGQTLCILEAMKLMNEFQAEFDLVIVNILVENSKMVEFGTPLFEVRRA